jgi:hypothetical protein
LVPSSAAVRSADKKPAEQQNDILANKRRQFIGARPTQAKEEERAIASKLQGDVREHKIIFFKRSIG